MRLRQAEAARTAVARVVHAVRRRVVGAAVAARRRGWCGRRRLESVPAAARRAAGGRGGWRSLRRRATWAAWWASRRRRRGVRPAPRALHTMPFTARRFGVLWRRARRRPPFRLAPCQRRLPYPPPPHRPPPTPGRSENCRGSTSRARDDASHRSTRREAQIAYIPHKTFDDEEKTANRRRAPPPVAGARRVSLTLPAGRGAAADGARRPRREEIEPNFDLNVQKGGADNPRGLRGTAGTGDVEGRTARDTAFSYLTSISLLIGVGSDPAPRLLRPAAFRVWPSCIMYAVFVRSEQQSAAARGRRAAADAAAAALRRRTELGPLLSLDGRRRPRGPRAGGPLPEELSISPEARAHRLRGGRSLAPPSCWARPARRSSRRPPGPAAQPFRRGNHRLAAARRHVIGRGRAGTGARRRRAACLPEPLLLQRALAQHRLLPLHAGRRRAPPPSRSSSCGASPARTTAAGAIPLRSGDVWRASEKVSAMASI